DDAFKSSIVTLSSDSYNRIKVGNTPFKIESPGMVRSTETVLAVERISRRILDRYKFAARFFDNVQVLYKTGYNLEIGDVVLFGGENTKLIDIQTGERDFPIAMYEIVNKQMAIETGKIVSSLLETGFSVEGRFGVISPSSLVGQASTTERIYLKKFLDVGRVVYESDKWQNWIGAKVVVRSDDYTFYEEVELLDIPQNDPAAIIVTPLSIAPNENYFVELANYDSQPLNEVGNKVKLKYAFLMEQQFVKVVIDNQSFQANIDGLFVGQKILIHSDDYASDSIQVLISDIVGDVVTLSEPIGFIPQVGDKIETLSFASDGG